MQIQEIEVVIDEAGQVEVHVIGIKGGECLEATKALEKALGGGVVSREFTAEASEQAEDATANGVQQHHR